MQEAQTPDGTGELRLERSRGTAILDLVLISSARLLAILGQVLNIRMLSTNLSTNELGHYFLLLTVSYALTASLFVPMDYFQQSKVHSLMNQHGTLHSLLVFNLRVLKIVAGVGVGATVLIGFFRPEFTIAVGATIFSACVLYTSQGLRGYLNNLGHRRRNAFNTMCETLLRLASVKAALVMGTATGIGVFLYIALAVTALTFLLWWDCSTLGFFRRPDQPEPKIRLTSFIRTGYPISVSSVAIWLQLQGYRMVLVPMGFADLVGIYATVANVGTAGMSAASSVFAQMYAPKIYSSNGAYTSIFIRNALVVIAAVALVGWALSSSIIPLLTSPRFLPHANLVVLGILAEGGNLLIGAVSAYLVLKTRTGPLLAASVTGLLTVVVLFAAMVTFWEVSFATIAVPVVGSQLVVVLHLWLAFMTSKRHSVVAQP